MADYDAEYPSGFFGCFFPTNRFTKRILHVSDILMTACVVTPLVVAHWWGSFAFMDRYPEYFPLWPTLAFGLSWHLLMALTRHHIHATVRRPEHVPKSLLRSVGSFLFTKGYIYVFSVSGILCWRAMFNLMQQFGGTMLSEWIMLIVFGTALIFSKGVINLVGPPFAIAVDSKESSFEYPTRFKTNIAPSMLNTHYWPVLLALCTDYLLLKACNRHEPDADDTNKFQFRLLLIKDPETGSFSEQNILSNDPPSIAGIFSV